jgi:hypothetical protein
LNGDEREEALDRNRGYEVDEKKREQVKNNEEKKSGANLGDEREEALDRNRGYEVDEKKREQVKNNEEKRTARISPARRKKRSIAIVVMKLMKRREKK